MAYHSSTTDDREDILTDVPEIMPIAAKWERAINYIIDLTALYVLLIGVRSLAGWLIDEFGFPFAMAFWLHPVKRIIVNYGIYWLFMTLSETSLHGRSIGKLLTYTRAVRTDGQRFTSKDAAARSLTRLIPLEFISIFFGGILHDRWTRTQVIKE